MSDYDGDYDGGYGYQEPDWDWLDHPHKPRRQRCILCDNLDHHDHYVQLRNVHNRWIVSIPICTPCWEKESHDKGAVVLNITKWGTYNRETSQG